MTYIVFEGIDRAGKTTAYKTICDRITKMGDELEATVMGVTEPMSKESFAHIDPRDYEMMAIEMTRQRVPVPRFIGEHDLVISDRSFISTYAYQGINGDLQKWIMEINNFIPNPDMVYLFDLDPAIALERKGKDHDELAFLEDMENLTEVRNRFYNFFKEYPEISYCIIDARKSEEKIVEEIWNDMIRNKFIY